MPDPLGKTHPASMTGFGASTHTLSMTGDQARWELRSVNAKGLDIRLKLPSGFEALEPKLKRQIQERFKRGSIHANCTLVKSEDAKSGLHLNEDALKNYFSVRQKLEQEFGPFAPINFDHIALDTRFHSARNTNADFDEHIKTELIAGLEPAIDALHMARLSEGEKLQKVLVTIIEQIETTLAHILRCVDQAATRPHDRLKMQVETLLGDHKIDPDRLAQEVALLATKADIREETDRLQAHCQEAKTLLNSGDLIGRRLDFLSQEFSREANTLCAKASTNEITRLGLDLKVMIDQFREQTQNVE